MSRHDSDARGPHRLTPPEGCRYRTIEVR
jgi:hypothetical protein